MKIKFLKILNFGWSNTLYLGMMNSKKVIFKIFSFNPRTFFLLVVYVVASFLRFEIPPSLPMKRRRRLKNESRANKTLKKMGIKAPRILFENHFIVYSIVKGKSMYEFLKETKNLELVRKIAFIKGTELAKIHKNGYAFVDNKVANTIITQKLELYSIDHEFFCFKAKKFQRELDFITLAATLPSNVFHEFWKSFCLGYKKIRKEIPKIERKDMLGIGMIGFTLMHLFGFL